MKKNCYWIAGAAIAILFCASSCNPAAKENEKLQKEAQEYGEKTREMIEKGNSFYLNEIFQDIEPVKIDVEPIQVEE